MFVGSKPLIHVVIIELIIFLLLCGCTTDQRKNVQESRAIPSRNCKDCHIRVYNEWLLSSHSKAWSSENYHSFVVEYNFETCKVCHIPAPISPIEGKIPVARDSDKEEGVNCAACHGDGCPHFMQKSLYPENYPFKSPWKKESTLLCGSCHRTTFQEWTEYTKLTNVKGGIRSCTYCHMPLQSSDGVESGVANDDKTTATILFSKQRMSDKKTKLEKRQHQFRVSYKKSVTVCVSKTQQDDDSVYVKVTLLNESAGHSIPTGSYGFKEVRLEVWFDKYSPDNVRTKRFFIEMGNALSFGSNGPYCFSFPKKGRELNIRVLRLDGDGKILSVLGQYDTGKASDN